jgi:hypothetical protein
MTTAPMLSQFDATEGCAAKQHLNSLFDFQRSAKKNPKCFPNRAEQGRVLG